LLKKQTKFVKVKLAIICIFIGTIICKIDFTALSYVLYNPTFKNEEAYVQRKRMRLLSF
jgi:hypothetical protein